MRVFILLVFIMWTASLFALEQAVVPPKAECEMCKTTNDTTSKLFEGPRISASSRVKLLPIEIYTLQDQEGRNITSLELLSKPTAMTFLYTHCDNPKKCPLVAKTISELQKLLTEKNLASAISLCVVTYDPERDTPDILKEYSKKFNLEGIRLLRPEPAKKLSFFEQLNVSVNFNKDLVNVHGIQLLLIDRNGRLAKSYHSVIWNNSNVLEELKALVAEK